MMEIKELSNINNGESIGFVLRILMNYLSQSLSYIFQKSGITPTEFLVLREVFENELISSSSLALHLKMNKGSISKIIDQLAYKKLIKKEISSLDKRVQKIFLTEKAYKTLPELAALIQLKEKDIFAILTDSERNTLYSLVEKIVSAQNEHY